MIYRFEIILRKSRRWLSRSEWASSLLGLDRSAETATAPGLVIIQIDGLSRNQLLHAIDNNRMPFLDKLVKRERYRLYTHYSGIPSSTPAVQGELFYGVKTVVPAFSFFDRATGEIVRMFDPASAARYEHELEKKGEPLLKGGSAYSNIFTGGASETHFCPSAIGWGEVLRAANPLTLIFLIVTNAYSIVRIIALLILEFFLAISDFVSGVVDGRDLLKEFKFVPTRVAICILLRELITIGAKIDITRGLPVIHLNFLGYDEQAHRRGPSSGFAHWTLKGIDDAIARIWHAARRSIRRDYDVWIYSDHGQEETISYPSHYGVSIESVVADVFEQYESERFRIKDGNQRGEQLQRVRLLGGNKIQRLFPVYSVIPIDDQPPELAVSAMGPVAMINYSRTLEFTERRKIAMALVSAAKIPLVLIADAPGTLRAWTAEGEFRLPEHKEQIMGTHHPFLEDVTQDLIDMGHHPGAGDFILCGWAHGKEPYSFSIENGSHAGLGAEETQAFALLPGHTALSGIERDYLRPLDLRHAALHILGRDTGALTMKVRQMEAARKTLRVMTYNVHSCIGMDGRLSPERIARVIAEYSPDIVALQELDAGKLRTGGVDQAHLIAQYLEMEYHFHPAIHIEEERYGDAVITRLPMRLIKAGTLPGLRHRPQLEPRGAIWAAIDAGGKVIQFINTHLGLWPGERKKQAAALLGEKWLAHPECHSPVILAGDFNALPGSPVCKRLSSRLNDAQTGLANHRPKSTLFGRYPVARIDHVFVDPCMEIDYIEVPDTALARVASDHLPLIVDIRIPSQLMK